MIWFEYGSYPTDSLFCLVHKRELSCMSFNHCIVLTRLWPTTIFGRLLGFATPLSRGFGLAWLTSGQPCSLINLFSFINIMLNCLGSTRFVEPENELSKHFSSNYQEHDSWEHVTLEAMLDWLVIVLYVQWILQTTRTLVSLRALLRFSHTLCAVVSLALLPCGRRGAAHSHLLLA